MADYEDSKAGPSVYPENATEAEHQHLEPIIGPGEVRSRHLFGIPLVSQMQDPLTGRALIMTDDMISDIIEGAVEQAQDECHMDIWPVKRSEKHAFDRNAYESYGYLQLKQRPAFSLDRICVMPANGTAVYTVPLEWVEVNYLPRGQINIIPMTAAFVTGGGVSASGAIGGAWFMALVGNAGWVPAYWQVDYTSGFKDSMVPRLVNDLIGTITAMEILSQLAATYARSNSHSLGIDGMSQSVSTPGPNIFQPRLQDLEAKKKRLVNKLKARYGAKIFSGHV